MQRLFEIGPISLADCALSLALGFIPVSALELWKLVHRGISRGPRTPGGVANKELPISGALLPRTGA